MEVHSLIHIPKDNNQSFKVQSEWIQKCKYFYLPYSFVSWEAFPNAYFQFTNYQIIKTTNMISTTEMSNMKGMKAVDDNPKLF